MEPLTMIAELVNKYANAVQNTAVLISDHDMGAVRLALRLALDELQIEHKAALADIDAIIADLLQQRDELKGRAVVDSAELLRLQTDEDRLITWLSEHLPEHAAPLANGGSAADAVIAALQALTAQHSAGPNILQLAASISALNTAIGEQSAITVAPPAAITYTENGSSGAGPSGRRFKGTDDELRQQTYAALRTLAGQLGHTPSMREWNAACQQFRLLTVDGTRKRLNMESWSSLCAAAGLQPNAAFTASAADQPKGDTADAAPFRP